MSITQLLLLLDSAFHIILTYQIDLIRLIPLLYREEETFFEMFQGSW